MTWHLIAFTIATFTGLLPCVLFGISKYVDSEDTKIRLKIAATSFQVMTLPLWNAVQALILYAIVKYGKPLEADAKKLIANKLAQ